MARGSSSGDARLMSPTVSNGSSPLLTATTMRSGHGAGSLKYSSHKSFSDDARTGTPGAAWSKKRCHARFPPRM
eukprot:4445174-Alexandrium_andersonii.AAC.1